MADCKECSHIAVCVLRRELGWVTCPFYGETIDAVAVKTEVARLEQDVTRLVQENETVKDNNEHLAVMLEEAKVELEAMRTAANSYKMHYNNLAREIFEEIGDIVWSHSDAHLIINRKWFDEIKKKYTGG